VKCSNKPCGQETDRQIFWADKRGRGHWGCPNCIRFIRERVRTGKKFWHSYEVYGVEKTKQKNYDWFKHQQEKAAARRRENAVISEGAYNVLLEHTQRGMLRPRRDGRPIR
jgi:hypothetical protein